MFLTAVSGYNIGIPMRTRHYDKYERVGWDIIFFFIFSHNGIFSLSIVFLPSAGRPIGTPLLQYIIVGGATRCVSRAIALALFAVRVL